MSLYKQWKKNKEKQNVHYIIVECLLLDILKELKGGKRKNGK